MYRTCADEGRVLVTLVTLDLDFANPFVFDPRPTAGIIRRQASRVLSQSPTLSVSQPTARTR